MVNNKQAGNHLIIIVLLIAAIIVFGVVVWRVFFDNKNDAPETTTATSNGTIREEETVASAESSSTNPNAEYFVIEEWDLRLRPVNENQEIVYTMNAAGDTVIFSTAELNATANSCSDSQSGEKPLGELKKLSNEQTTFEPTEDNGGAFIKPISGTYYQYITPQSACSENAEIAELQNTIYNSFFKPSIATLEAMQE